MPYEINLCAFYVNEYNRKFICAAAGDGVHLQFSKKLPKIEYNTPEMGSDNCDISLNFSLLFNWKYFKSLVSIASFHQFPISFFFSSIQ